MLSKYEALKSLIECQKEVLKFNKRENFKEIPEYLQENILEYLLTIEKLIKNNSISKTEPDKFNQKLTYSSEGFMLHQPTKGGSYMLWSEVNDNAVQCGIGFDADNTGYVDTDLFLAETKTGSKKDSTDPLKNNKDIDLYIYADPYTEEYTDYRRIAFSDLKEALELD